MCNEIYKKFHNSLFCIIILNLALEPPCFTPGAPHAPLSKINLSHSPTVFTGVLHSCLTKCHSDHVTTHTTSHHIRLFFFTKIFFEALKCIFAQ